MVAKHWKKFEQSAGFCKLKLKFRQLVGKEPSFRLDIELNTKNFHGWVLVPELIQSHDIVYSIGICDDIAFELALIKQKKVQIFAFDPTPYSVQWIDKQALPLEFQFQPWAVSDQDGEFFFYPRIKKNGETSKVMYTFHKQQAQRNDCVTVDAFTLETMTKKLNHQQIDLLKMDIEGAEYDVIENMISSALRPKLLLIEFHHRFKGIGKAKTINAVAALRKVGYLVLSVSVTGREISFVYKSAISSLS